MYKISKKDDCLVVEFRQDFNFATFKSVMHNIMQIPGYSGMNEIHLIGKHHAQVRLGEIQSIVEEYCRTYQDGTDEKKIAVVVEQGLTEAIIQLIASGLKRQQPMKYRIFRQIDDAHEWLGLPSSQIA